MIAKTKPRQILTGLLLAMTAVVDGNGGGRRCVRAQGGRCLQEARAALWRSAVKVRVRLVGSISLLGGVVDTCPLCCRAVPAASR